MAEQQKEFLLPIRVYYEDTDAGGIVYHANYLKYMERARSEWLLARGINLDHYAEETDTLFVVRDLTIRYHKPARLCDDLTVKTTIAKRTRTRVLFEQNIYRDKERLTSATVEIVALNRLNGRPLSLPGLFN